MVGTDSSLFSDSFSKGIKSGFLGAIDMASLPKGRATLLIVVSNTRKKGLPAVYVNSNLPERSSDKE